MLMNEVIALIAILLILINLRFTSYFPTKIAYVLMSFSLVINIELDLVYKIVVGITIWLLFAVFHFLIWRHILNKVHSNPEILELKFNSKNKNDT